MQRGKKLLRRVGAGIRFRALWWRSASSTSESESNPPRVGLKVTPSAYTVAAAAVSVVVALAANESMDEAASFVVSSN